MVAVFSWWMHNRSDIIQMIIRKQYAIRYFWEQEAVNNIGTCRKKWQLKNAVFWFPSWLCQTDMLLSLQHPEYVLHIYKKGPFSASNIRNTAWIPTERATTTNMTFWAIQMHFTFISNHSSWNTPITSDFQLLLQNILTRSIMEESIADWLKHTQQTGKKLRNHSHFNITTYIA